MVQIQGIDFFASHLHWITLDEASHGWFQIDAILEWLPVAPQQPLQFVLAAAVPAGRMYAPVGPLLKQPPYSFQLIAGPNDHTILRRPLDFSQAAVPADSSAPHNTIFKTLTWELSRTEAQPLSPEELATLPTATPVLNLLLDWRHHGGNLRLQTPLRHWNHRSNQAGWQIETGPLLWPLDKFAFAESPSSARLTSCSVSARCSADKGV